ncbi:spindle assembly abnormal protein 6 homolog [Aedes aegypti]|uniref:Uncharacterized protein n=1 Tax=Aedes aegypti TaxID=7159 RepID=A0A6I8TZI3_AEDAE|nr:spindle assembly abnormal protein 6 homolog [Aedes aegypti]
MSHRPVSAKIDTGLPKSVRERQISNLSRKSSQTVANKPTNARVSLPQRPKSASHCCGATDSPGKRPWSNSVLIDSKFPNGSCCKNDANKPSPNHKLGHIPAYIRKMRSSSSFQQARIEDRLEDESPPPLVPSEKVLHFPERRLLRQRTFNQKEHQQLEEALKELTEEKKMLEAQNQWLKEESESRLQIIGTESERNKQLEAQIREMSEAMVRLQSEQKTVNEIDSESSPSREELMERVHGLQAENESLRKEMEELHIQSCEDIMNQKQDPEKESNDQSECKTIGLLQRDLEKYRMARKKLKEIIQTLMVENHRLRSSLENHCIEGSLKEELVEVEQPVKNDNEEEVVRRVDFFEDLRKEKRTQQKLIEVKKYNS